MFALDTGARGFKFLGPWVCPSLNIGCTLAALSTAICYSSKALLMWPGVRSSAREAFRNLISRLNLRLSEARVSGL